MSRSPRTIGAQIRRWIAVIASSSRSSLSTSSHRPPPTAASRPRNPALTAWSMPDRVHPHPGHQPGALGQDLVLVADLAVGDQDEHPVAPGFAGPQQPQPLLERREQFRPAARVGPAQVLDRAEPVPVGGGHEPAGQVVRTPRPCCRRCARRSGRRHRGCPRCGPRPGGRRPSSSRPCCRSGRAAAPRRAARVPGAGRGGTTVSSKVPSAPSSSGTVRSVVAVSVSSP